MGIICLDAVRNCICPELKEEQVVAVSNKMLHAAFHKFFVVNEKFLG
jgi:hypothetical protein